MQSQSLRASFISQNQGVLPTGVGLRSGFELEQAASSKDDPTKNRSWRLESMMYDIESWVVIVHYTGAITR